MGNSPTKDVEDSILNAKVGESIVEWENRRRITTKIRKIVHNACSSRGTHVNDRYCYERNAIVTLTVEADSMAEFEAEFIKDKV
jgi:hypothetical protein